MVEEFIINEGHYEYDFSIEDTNKVRKKLSSGQSIILYTRVCTHYLQSSIKKKSSSY
jgi:uncharacterized protein YheU (UPF0270 family)